MKSDPREKPPTFELRVNGVVVEACLRPPMTDPGEHEVVVRDPLIGEFAINDEFAIDVKRHAGTAPIWSRVSLKHLKSTFLGVISDDLPSVSEILESELFTRADAVDVPQRSAKSSQIVLVASQARRAQRILYQAGIPSIVMSLTPHRMRNSEGALVVPNLRAARCELLAHGFQAESVKYLLKDTKTGNKLLLVQRWIGANKGATNDPSL